DDQHHGPKNEGTNDRRIGSPHGRWSPRVRNWWTLGSGDSASSFFGSPCAIIVLASASSKTEFVPIVKMLANSCVTTTTVAPRLRARPEDRDAARARAVRIRASGGFTEDQHGRTESHRPRQPRPLLHPATQFRRVVRFKTC